MCKDAKSFALFGSPQYWHQETIGHDGSATWTTATEGPLDNFGVWSFRFSQSGTFSVEVFTVAPLAQAQAAAYQVAHGDNPNAVVTDTVVLDQTAANGWQSLGEFSFADATDYSIRLEDVTGEPLSEDRKLVFDAVRLTNINPMGAGGAGGATTTSTASSGANGTGGASSVGSGAGAAASNGPSDTGCSCRSAGRARPHTTGLWCLLAAAVGVHLVRRRRRFS